MTESEWIADFTARAGAAGDAERLRLVSLVREAFAYRESQPERTLATCDDGRLLARRLGESWWGLWFQAHAVHQLVHFSRDFRQARELVVAAVLEARKPAYDGCPFRARLYQDLLAVHFCIDPDGYADRIEEGFREAEACLPGDFASRLHLLNLRRWRLEQARRRDEHAAAARRVLALIADDPKHSASVHYSTFVYNGLCRVHCALGEWPELAEAAALAAEASARTDNRVELAKSALWSALHALHVGDAARAQALRLRGVRGMRRLGVPPPDGYFEALSLLAEHAGRPDEALAVREQELALLRAQGRTVSEVYCHRERCRLLAAARRLTAADLEAARAAARRLRFPEPHLAALDCIAP